MVAGSILILNVVILCALLAYSLLCISHIAAGWFLRKHFQMAVRSPLLLTMSGTTSVLISFVTAVHLMLFYGPDPGPVTLVAVPMGVALNTCAYVMRGVRLLVMYNPTLRKRYGPYINEIAMAKALVTSFVALEGIIWSLSLVLGVERVARYTVLVIILNVLITVGATLALIVKLRRTNDLFDMATEIKSVGAFLLISLALTTAFFAAPSSLQPYTILAGMIFRFYATLWISNVRPTRTILGRTVGGWGDKVPWFPFVPWRSASNKAVVTAGQPNLPRTTTIRSSETSGLDYILGFPPLLSAFKEYCRKALCSESIMFLIEVSEFNDALEAANADNHQAEHFERLQAMADKYIKDGAPFEINIGFQMKSTILKLAAAESYQDVTLAEIAQALAPAAKEIGDMLKANLHNKFRRTEEYRQITNSFEDPDESD